MARATIPHKPTVIGPDRRRSRLVRRVPRFLRRARRARSLADSSRFAHLLEPADVATLLTEIRRASRALLGAEASDLWLWRTRTPWGAGGPHPHNAPADAVLRRLQAGHAVVTRDANGINCFFPLVHATRILGCVQLGLQHDPTPAARAALRRYVALAGTALARALAEERTARQLRRYEALLDSLPDACLLLLDAHGVIQGVRGHASGLLGRSPDRVIGQALVAPDARRGLVKLGRNRLRALFTAARQQGKARHETQIRTEGGEVDVQLTLVDLHSNGEFVCVLRDLTEVKTMERVLLRRNDELQQAAERLKEIDILKNEFMSNVSHELRTPLTAIIAYSEALLISAPDPNTQKDFLRVIAEQGHKLQRLIGGLLDIAKLESLATELKLQEGDLNEVVRAAFVTVRPQADNCSVTVELDLAADLPRVFLDELRAQQIVWNLLSNAIKFSPAGSIVRVRTWHADDAVWGAITDQGIGIAPEYHELIFEKFVQVDGSSTRRHGGVGLGLDLVKHLVELHGGSVRVESVPGAGATFTFSIPLEKRRRSRLGRQSRVAATTAGKRS